MNKNNRTTIFLSPIVYLLIVVLLALNLVACGVKSAITPEQPTSQATFVYAVKEGDTCSALAERFETTVEEITALNGLAATCPIMIGQALIIPVAGAEQPTEVPTYDYRGITVYLKTEFPQTPASMKVYTAREEQLATVDSVKKFAEQFEMNGAIYEISPESGIPSWLGRDKEYLVVDGNRQLHVRSDKYFSYIPNIVSQTDHLYTLAPPNAENLIHEFMQTYGFDFSYNGELQDDKLVYAAMALSPEGLDIRHGYLGVDGLRFNFDMNGIAFVSANLSYYDETALMEIISAEEALQKFLNPDNLYGYLQGGGGGGFFMVGDMVLKPEDFKKWTRIRPFDETITYTGYLSSTGRSVDGGAPLILLNGYTVVGNVGDIPENAQNIFIEARGKFHDENGVKTFELESWEKYDGFEETIFGTLKREGDQFILDDGNGKKYILQDIPTEISLPMKNAFVRGVMRDGVFDWNVIDNNGGGGGGGGGGSSGFYRINFGGIPVAFPTLAPATPVPTPVVKPVVGLRGTLQVNITPFADGTERVVYQFIPYEGGAPSGPMGGTLLLLSGKLGEDLKAYHNRPIDVWGTIADDYEVTVERYEIPFPDLKFQIVKGSQKLETIEGQSVTIVTTDDGEKYIALMTLGAPAPTQLTDPSFIPDPNSFSSVPKPDADNVLYEALIIPGETLLGYPGMRVFGIAPGVVDGKLNSLPIVNDQPNVFPGPPQVLITSMTIEKIELAYYVPDNPYVTLNDAPSYMQPVWRFYGHYNDGSLFEILVQALKPEFLLPEVDPATGQ